ncbi:uncharacterized protein RSE6_00765 [Rhynchosporium secalis]|uniref:Uncharacterized protein n=1 Tax=Rhynchosporium secalis TaxID=38038 RepID=A0A1E1LW59_RHYSE|nr:uncharacterized protein RSE6_00765 [Rhynchosporium secalis]
MKYEYLRGKEGQGYLNGTEWSRDGHRTIPSLNRPPNWESPGDGSLTFFDKRTHRDPSPGDSLITPPFTYQTVQRPSLDGCYAPALASKHSRLTDHIHQEAVTVSETVASDSSFSKVRGRSRPRLREPRKVLSDGRHEAIHTCFRISSETRRGSLTCCQAHSIRGHPIGGGGAAFRCGAGDTSTSNGLNLCSSTFALVGRLTTFEVI